MKKYWKVYDEAVLHIEARYVELISPRLRNFKRKSSYLFNCSCPVSGCDESRRSRKSRFYIYERDGKLFAYCHKCGYSRTFANFLKKFDEALYREFVLEEMMERPAAAAPEPIRPPSARDLLDQLETSQDLVGSKLEGLEPLLSLPTTHIARRFCSSRAIPNYWEERMYFAPKFFEWAEKIHLGTFQDRKRIRHEEQRVVIPFARAGYQGRALQPESKVKYITVITDDKEPFLFALDRVDPDEKIIAFEGPIDAMFIDNAIASGGSSIIRELSRLPFERDDFIICYDNEPRSPQTVKKMEHAAMNGYPVCIWPKSIRNKDVNDMILAGMEATEIEYIIKDCAKKDLKALTAIENWKK